LTLQHAVRTDNPSQPAAVNISLKIRQRDIASGLIWLSQEFLVEIASVAYLGK
jgi:hypothetical protein